MSEDNLLDRTKFVLPPEKYHEFLRILSNPPYGTAAVERLKALMASRAPWDETPAK